MRLILLMFLLFTVTGCTSTGSAKSAAPDHDPALEVAKIVTQQEPPGAALLMDIARRLDSEEEFWRDELGNQFSGADLEQALRHVAEYKVTMLEIAQRLALDEVVHERVANYFRQVFTQEELLQLERMLESPLWQKYQWETRRMGISDDPLGLYKEFFTLQQEQQDLMGERIFGKQPSSASAGH